MGVRTSSWVRRLALGALMGCSIVHAADPANIEEQKPIADPLADNASFDDSVWTSSPFYERAISLMKESPLVDTHIDLPQVLQSLGEFPNKHHLNIKYVGYAGTDQIPPQDRHPLSIFPDLAIHVPGHIDIPRLRKGHLGAAFWTVWAPCDVFIPGRDPGPAYLAPDDGLRDALEVLDLIHEMIDAHPAHLQAARTAADVRAAFAAGKVASLVGVEGTHFLGNSLATVRLLARLGVRYVSLTHMCHSAFASSAGFGSVGGQGPLPPLAPSGHGPSGNGLSALGRALVAELNRLGVLVDLSHASDEAAREALTLSRAPVVWTHSVARALHAHPRNVPDDLLRLVGPAAEGKNPGVVQCVFFPPFVGPTVEAANVSRLADHIEHVAGIVGKKHVGIGSDFDGMVNSVKGLEDATKYPNLVSTL